MGGIATTFFFPYSIPNNANNKVCVGNEDNGMSYSNEMRHDESSPIAINFLRSLSCCDNVFSNKNTIFGRR